MKLPTRSVYVQVWDNRIKATCFETGYAFDDEAIIAFQRRGSRKERVAGIGQLAKPLVKHPFIQSWPFNHPRLIFCDIESAQRLLIEVIHYVLGRRINLIPMRIIFQPMDRIEGGIPPVEQSLINQLLIGVGANQHHVCHSSELISNAEQFHAIFRAKRHPNLARHGRATES